MCKKWARVVSLATVIFLSCTGFTFAQMGTSWMLDKSWSSIQMGPRQSCKRFESPEIRIKACSQLVMGVPVEQAVQALYTRASGYDELQQYDKAIDDYQRIIDLAPNEIQASVLKCRDTAMLNNAGSAALGACGSIPGSEDTPHTDKDSH